MLINLSALVSGGQTGVDRAALDFAIATGIFHRGWCPRGRRAEDGPLPGRCNLTETASRDYSVRTRQNVHDSDGTLILFRSQLEGGSAKTCRIARQLKRPLLVIDLVGPERLASLHQVRAWLKLEAISALNIAGPRESKQPEIYAQALQFLHELAGNSAMEMEE